MVTIEIKNQNKKFKDVELVALDKDGTVLTYDMYSPVMIKRTEELIKQYNLPQEETYPLILEIMGIDPHTNKVILGGSIHDARLDIIKRTIDFLREYGNAPSISEVSELFDKVDEEVNFAEDIKVQAGVTDFLKAIKSKGVKIIMITHDSTPAATKHLKHAKILDYFDLILGLDYQCPYNPKPAPDMLQYGCKTLEVDVHKAIVIGDDNKDMLVAKNAGALGAIGVLTGKADKDQLPNADVIITNFEELSVK